MSYKDKHMFTREILFHFTCGECKNWWSYANSIGHSYFGWEMTCPHCGEKKKVKLDE